MHQATNTNNHQVLGSDEQQNINCIIKKASLPLNCQKINLKTKKIMHENCSAKHRKSSKITKVPLLLHQII